MEKREFKNKYPGYKGQELLNKDGKISDEFGEHLRETLNQLLYDLFGGLESCDPRDYSVYTGQTGISLLYFHLYNCLDERTSTAYLQNSVDIIIETLPQLKGKRCSFLCGDAGPLALGAVVFESFGKNAESKECIKILTHLHTDICTDKELPDEMLYGRAGYLHSLLFVQKHLGIDSIDSACIQKVFHSIISSGQRLARSEKWACPLMWAWHDKHYLGAAHGVAGILYMLMQVNDTSLRPQIDSLVKPTIDYLMTLKYPSGNYPSSIGSRSGDVCVHWCHGAPGWVHMFSAAYKLFGDEKYLIAARGCADVIWERGILRKGYGICHGTAGNAYGFLSLYNVTNEQKYLYRAIKFAEWCMDYGTHGCREADRPFSLFEGLAGTIYFLVDLLNPGHAKFPAFEL